MEFWQIAWDMGVITEEKLRKAVRTEVNKWGDITKDEFKFICGKNFDLIANI